MLTGLNNELKSLKDCFREDFTSWLLKSNKTKDKPYLLNDYMRRDRFINERIYIEGESLTEILNILIREPNADCFWYSYSGKITYAVPAGLPAPVPCDCLRVDKEKIKFFLRDLKLNSILD